jgi:hypothetical protein
MSQYRIILGAGVELGRRETSPGLRHIDYSRYRRVYVRATRLRGVFRLYRALLFEPNKSKTLAYMAGKNHGDLVIPGSAQD